MRRSLFAGIGVAAVLIFAACSPDQPATRGPLAPTEPSLAQGPQCKNTLANAIEAKHDLLFSETDEAILNTAFAAVKSECSTSSTTPSANLLAYMQTVVNKRGTVDPTALVGLWDDVTLYATGTAIGRPAAVFAPGSPATTPGGPYTRSGGAAVLNPGLDPVFMYTFDGQAGIKLTPNPTSGQTPAGPHLWTLYPTDCPETSLRDATPDCYEVDEYPEATAGWNPAFSMGMCMRHTDDEAAVTHEDEDYGTEVLPDGAAFPWDATQSCANTHAFIDSWLGRKAGPLGRVLARGLDYLRPQTLFADDAGESGLGFFTSPFGGALTVIFDESFDAPDNNLGPFANGTDPDVGDKPSSWDVFAPSPGFVNVVDAATFVPAGPNVPVAGGGLLGQVIALSQSQGACKKNCPVYKLLGTRVNPTPADEIGTYQVTWQSLQNKPSIKEAPFVLLSASGVEIARLSYITQSNQNRILYNGVNTGVSWVQNAAQSFKIVVRLEDDDPATTNRRTDLYIGNMTTPVLSNVAFKTANQTTFSTVGYRLDGVDAGVMLADNIVVTRLRDKP